MILTVNPRRRHCEGDEGEGQKAQKEQNTSHGVHKEHSNSHLATPKVPLSTLFTARIFCETCFGV